MIDKDLQDLAWRCLPREFREEVKKMFEEDKKHPEIRTTCGITTAYHNDMGQRLIDLFGIDNLTSDAEGEEMLMCEKSRVQKIFAGQTEVQKSTPCGTILHHEAAAKAELLYALFGSKCLPEEPTIANNATVEEPKPAEPKFNYKVDDKVRVKGVNNYILCGKVGVIKKLPDEIEPFNYKIGFENDKYTYLSEEYLEPYTEPKEKSPQMKPIESKVSVYLATKEEEEEFRLLLHENGFTWNTGTSLKGCSFWVNHTEESKILYVHPDMTVTYWGNKTPDTLTFSEFKKRYFKCNDHIVQDHDMVDGIIKHGFKNHNRLHIAAMMMQGMLSNTTRFSSYEISDLVRISLNCADALLREAEKGGSK